MSVLEMPPLPEPPPGGYTLPPPEEFFNHADRWRYGFEISVARHICYEHTGDMPRHPAQCWYDAGKTLHDNYTRAIVPYDFHRDLRRLNKIKKLHPASMFFYRYAHQTGKGARVIKNWLYVAKIKTDKLDGSYYRPCGAVPLPAPPSFPLPPNRAPDRTPRKITIQWIPVPAMQHELPAPEGYYPRKLQMWRE